jgi:predicted deacetylase
MPRQLLVAVHDVTPAHADRIRRMLVLLAQAGVAQYALFVVPQWHGEWELTRYPEFTGLLREHAGRGSEIFLHGLRHDEHGARRSWLQAIRAFGRTDREGEFLALPPGEAGRRMDHGLEILGRCGLTPVGFVPPAWLHGRDWRRLLRERRLTYSESSWAVFDVAAARRRRASAYCWSTLKPWHPAAGARLAAARLTAQARASLLRVAIHPPDIDSPTIRDSLRRVLAALLARRVAVSYATALSSAEPPA